MTYYDTAFFRFALLLLILGFMLSCSSLETSSDTSEKKNSPYIKDCMSYQGSDGEVQCYWIPRTRDGRF